MKVVVAAAALMSIVSAPALAATDQTSADRAKILSCVQRAEKNNKSAASCIGVIADPCIALTSRGGTGDAKACAKRELAIWSDLLKDAITLAKKGRFPEINSMIEQTQQSWNLSREKLCPIFDSIDPGMALGGSDYCRLLETGGRVLNLRKLGFALNEH